MSINNKLKIGYWVPIVICSLMIVGYESGFFMEGRLSADKVLEYYWALAMQMITICSIPIALMLFRLPAVKKFIQRNSRVHLNICRALRLALLLLPMMLNVYLYYQFIYPGFGYMAIIGLLSSVFVYPSATRCQTEENVE
jgi:hypothetical protein